MWWMRGRVLTDRLPAERIVIEFDFRAVDDFFWLVLTRNDASPPDLSSEAYARAFNEVKMQGEEASATRSDD
jgi:hypothetical protein